MNREKDKLKNNQHDISLYENRKHGDLGFPMKIYWNDFTTYVAESIPWHWHEEMEFAYVTDGEVEVNAGPISVVLEKGEGIFINADTLHHMKPHGNEKAYMFTIVAHPDILGIEKAFLISSKYVLPYINSDMTKALVLKKDVDWQLRIMQNLQEMYQVYQNKEFGYEYKLHNDLCNIWYEMIQNAWKHQKMEETFRETDQTRIYQALRYIQNNYNNSLSLEEICKELHISKSECCRCFKRNLRMTPFEYIMIHRISVAAKLLERTNDTITEIAMNTGFNSNSYFCKIFKKYMNSSPIEYRKTKRK